MTRQNIVYLFLCITWLFLILKFISSPQSLHFKESKHWKEKYKYCSLAKSGNSINRGQSLDCLKSADSCLDYIKQSTGKTPVLMSFRKTRVIRTVHPKSGQNLTVPNVVHLINFVQPFVFYNYVTYMSIEKHVKPVLIFLWADAPYSQDNIWWKKATKQVANIYYVHTKRYNLISKKFVPWNAHSSDLLRMEILRGWCYYIIRFDNIMLFQNKNELSRTVVRNGKDYF